MTPDSTLQDLRYTFRTLRRDAGFTTFAILIVGLGIGASATVFSVVNALLVRPLPFRDPQQLVWLANHDSSGLSGQTTQVGHLLDMQARNQYFSALGSYMAFYGVGDNLLIGDGEPERLSGVPVSENFFQVLGVQPQIGRLFTADECKWHGPKAVILGHGLWQRRFDSDPAIVNRKLILNGEPYTVAGVLPATFDFSAVFHPGSHIDLYFPFPLSEETNRWGNTMAIVGRLKPGVSARQAQAEVSVIAAQITQAHPERNSFGGIVTPLAEHVSGRLRLALVVLASAVGVVMLIVCANLSNLLLARTATRQKEIAIRTALGAGRGRLVRQMLTEGVALSVCGAALGAVLAVAGTRLLAGLDAMNIPLLRDVRIDGTALGFTLLAAVLTGVIFGLAPALQAAGLDLNEALKEGSRSSAGGFRRSLRGPLVVAEVALALVLLVGAGLLVKSFWRLSQVDPGFDPQNVLAMQISINARPDEGPRVDNFLSQLQQRAQRLPGVQSVSVSNGLPFEGANFPPIVLEGKPAPPPGQDLNGLLYTVSPDYFKTMRIDLVRGRLFSTEDRKDTPQVALVDEVFARQYFPNEDPIGKRFKLNTPDADSREIIGVVRHVEHSSLEGKTTNTPEFYFNFDQLPLATLPRYVRRVNLLVRTTVEPLSLAGSVRNQIAALDKDQAVFNVRTMEQALAQSVAARRFSMILLAVFALLALTLAAVGIYGVISYSVAQRTREVGIRMALGARTIDVLNLVVRDGLKLVFIGIFVGLAGALLLTRLMTTLLFGVTTTDAVTYVTVALGLIIVALIACCIPARRATKVDPLVALRFE
jgi:predicted permease